MQIYSNTFLMLSFSVVEEGLVGGEGFAVDASFVKVHTSKKQRVKGHTDWKPVIKQTRAVKEYFEALDSEPSLNRHQGSISLTDPMAQWTAAKGTANFFNSTNYFQPSLTLHCSITLKIRQVPLRFDTQYYLLRKASRLIDILELFIHSQS